VVIFTLRLLYPPLHKRRPAGLGDVKVTRALRCPELEPGPREKRQKTKRPGENEESTSESEVVSTAVLPSATGGLSTQISANTPTDLTTGMMQSNAICCKNRAKDVNILT
jgi:hypothetical protein